MSTLLQKKSKIFVGYLCLFVIDLLLFLSFVIYEIYFLITSPFLCGPLVLFQLRNAKLMKIKENVVSNLPGLLQVIPGSK